MEDQHQIYKSNLVKPPEEFFVFVNILETRFVEEFDSSCYEIYVRGILLYKLKDIRPFLSFEGCDPKNL